MIWLGDHSEVRRYLDKRPLRTSVKFLGEVKRNSMEVFVDNKMEKSKRSVLESAKADETIQRLKEVTTTVMVLLTLSSNCYPALTLEKNPGVPSSTRTPSCNKNELSTAKQPHRDAQMLGSI